LHVVPSQLAEPDEEQQNHSMRHAVQQAPPPFGHEIGDDGNADMGMAQRAGRNARKDHGCEYEPDQFFGKRKRGANKITHNGR
jgi:hypothetical protein